MSEEHAGGWEVTQLLVNYAMGGLLVGAAIVILISLSQTSGFDICEQTNSTSGYYESPCTALFGKSSTGAELNITGDVTLHADHHGFITIDADHVTLDCAGHDVIGGGGPVGIEVTGRSDVTVENCFVIGFDVGIGLTDTTASRVVGNTALSNQIGFKLVRSERNELSTNASVLNQSGFNLTSSHSNNLDGNSTDRGYYGVQLFGSDDNFVSRGEIFDPFAAGMELAEGSANTVDGNFFSLENSWGGAIRLSGTGNALSANVIEGGNYGIRLSGQANTIANNRLDRAYEGITVEGSNHEVSDNVVQMARWGLQTRSDNSVYSGNSVSGGNGVADRGDIAFWVEAGSGNTFEGNRASDVRTGFGIFESTGNDFEANDASQAESAISGFAVTLGNTFVDNVGFGLAEAILVTEDLTLSGDHEGTIVIAADDVTLDCAGHHITAPNWTEGAAPNRAEVGVQLGGRAGVTIEKCAISGYEVGIGLWDADNSVIRNNTGSIRLERSRDNTLRHNTSSTITLVRTRRTVVRANTVTSAVTINRALRTVLDGNIVNGTITLDRTRRADVTRNEVDGDGGGIILARSDENTVADNIVTGGRIRLSVARDNTVAGNKVTTDRKNAFIIGQVAEGNLIVENVARKAEVGFRIYNSRGNTFRGNNATRCEIGRVLADSSDNTFEDNRGF